MAAMHLLAVGPNPAAGPLTYIFPLALFVGVMIWDYFHRSPR